MDDRLAVMHDRLKGGLGRRTRPHTSPTQHLVPPKKHYTRRLSIGLSVALSLLAGRVQALPGQTPDEAVVWIQANPTLRPVRGEKLLVRKSDTPAQRFMFSASPQQVGRASSGSTGGIIRTEETSFFDIQNGVTRDRLQEALRVIYGPTVYQDFAQAKTLYAYPTQNTLDRAVNRDTPLLAALQGEVREGDRYAYWLEIARQKNGFAYSGKIIVFLRDDLPKLEAELRNR
ncbi:hypothetical protein [Stenomitos frigidus]|uniref:hypothetical protein n=1 Tax=Stenomitos frigidus TaxID=1886765 RepID=UPI001FE4D995|nr:hypothetical protein [Stenomitos frigidus]